MEYCKEKKKKSNYLFDNIAFALMVCIVIGSFISDFQKYEGIKYIWSFIYIFSIPLFIFINGVSAKGSIKKRKNKVLNYTLLYLVIQIINILIQGKEFTIVSSTYGLWFLIAIIFYNLLLPLINKMKPSAAIIISVILGLIIGLDNNVNSLGNLSRIFVMLPFFVTGYFVDKKALSKNKNKKHIVLLSVIILALVVISVPSLCTNITSLEELLIGNSSYEMMNLESAQGLLYRAGWYAVSAITLLCILFVTPRRKIKIISNSGTRALQVYCLHIIAFLILKETSIYRAIDTQEELIFLIIGSAILAFILSMKVFSYPFKFIINNKFRLIYNGKDSIKIKDIKRLIKKGLRFIKKNFIKKTRDVRYAKYYKKCNIEKNTILYQAYSSKILAGNPYAIFKYLLENPQYKHLKHIWIVKDRSIRKQYKNAKNVKFVLDGSKEHMKYLATVEYLVNNAAFPSYFVKKEDQIYINTWHGTPLKGLGKYDKSLNRRPIMSAQRNLLCCDYLIMPNRYTTDIMMDHYDVRNIFKGKIIEEGYPRVDLVLKSNREELIRRLENKIGYSLNGKKIILYAPTFRSENIFSAKKHINNSNEICEYIEQIVENMPKEYVMFFKAHSNLLNYFKDNDKISNMFLFEDFETNEVLSVTDVLITDYSSVFFDYLATRRPIIFFTYDREKYERERGFLFPLNELPGKLCDTVDDVICSLKDIQMGQYNYLEKHNRFIEKFAYLDDGNASKRCIDIIFENKESKNVYNIDINKKNILLYLGKLGKGKKAETVLRYLKTIDYEQYNVILFGNYSTKEMNILQYINKDIAFVTYLKPRLYTTFEKIKKILFGYKAVNIYSREYARNLGKSNFDEIVNFNAKKTMFKKMFETAKFANKSIYRAKINKQEDIDNLIEQGYSKIITNEVTGVEENLNKDNIEIININVDDESLLEQMNVPLNVLFIAGFDSTNYIYTNIIDELNKRGHNYKILVRDIEDSVNDIMFKEDPNIVDIKDFKYDTLSQYDFVISTPIKLRAFNKLYKEIEKKNMFVYTFSTLFSSITMRVLGDIVLTVGENKFKEIKKNYLGYNMVAIGNPQYDNLIKNKKCEIKNDEIKRILFVEQGAYPCGTEGKKQLADTLINIAKNNKEKEIYIKPRYLPDEAAKTIHTVSEHLYDFLNKEDIPSNLILINEPTILEEILPEFDAMITMWSTAYMDAIAINMPLLLIEGFDSKDVFDIRTQRVNEAYEMLRDTGCVVNFKDLWDKPLEFKYVNEEFKHNEIYNVDHACSPEIVDLFEMINKKLLMTNKRFKGFFQKTAKDFNSYLNEIELFNKKDDGYKKWKKNYNAYNTTMQELVYINRCMENKLDLTECANLLEDLEAHTDISKEINTIRKEKEYQFFTSEDSKVNEDKILQDFYFDWLFRNKEYKEIEKYPHDNIIAKESYEYYLARIYLEKGNIHKSFAHISMFIKYVSDKNGSTELLKEKRLYENLKPFVEKERRYKLIKYLYSRKYYKEIILLNFPAFKGDCLINYYKLKAFNKLGLYDEAVNEYEMLEESKDKIKKDFRRVTNFLFTNSVEKQYNYAKKNIKER